MRQLWITNDHPPRAGGIEQFVGNLLSFQDPAAVRVIASVWPGDTAHDAGLPYPVERGRRPLLPGPRLLARARRAIEAHDPDVVVFGAAWPLAELAPRLGRPSIALTHGHEAGMARVGLGPLVGRVARRVDALGVISAFTRRALARWIDPATAVHHLPPGVDVERFTPVADGSAVRAAYGIPHDAPVVVCVGRLVARKGQDVLVEAWPRIRAAVPDARLLLAGAGPLERPLRERIGRLGLNGVVALTGELRPTELPAYHAAADLFAMPCRTRLRGLDVEGLGIVYLEAQACARPVLAGDSGGAPEALLPGQSGEVVDGRSPAAVAAAIVRLLGDPEALRQMGAAGRAFVEDTYAWPVIARRFAGIVEELPARRRAAD